MIQGKNCQSLSEFGVRHHSQIWPQRVGVLWADFVPHAVKPALDRTHPFSVDTHWLEYNGDIQGALEYSKCTEL